MIDSTEVAKGSINAVWQVHEYCESVGSAIAEEVHAAVQTASPGAPPTNYAGPSTFTTPAGTNAQNVNSKVQCSK